MASCLRLVTAHLQALASRLADTVDRLDTVFPSSSHSGVTRLQHALSVMRDAGGAVPARQLLSRRAFAAHGFSSLASLRPRSTTAGTHRQPTCTCTTWSNTNNRGRPAPPIDDTVSTHLASARVACAYSLRDLCRRRALLYPTAFPHVAFLHARVGITAARHRCPTEAPAHRRQRPGASHSSRECRATQGTHRSGLQNAS